MDSEFKFGKLESKALHGIAISMMLYHHLFCIHDRIAVPYFSVIGGVETYIAWFCKICVAIFAFTSGYGLYLSSNVGAGDKLIEVARNSIHRMVQLLIRFMRKYWLVWIIVIAVGYGINAYQIQELTMSWARLLNCLIGKDILFVGEWWYVYTYVTMLLVFPILCIADYLFGCLIDKWSKHKIKRSYLLVAAIILIILMAGVYAYHPCHKSIIWMYYEFCNPCMIIYLEGWICARFNLFGRFAKKINCGLTFNIVLFIVCAVVRMIVVKDPAAMKIDILLIAPAVFAMLNILNNSKKVKAIFAKLGKYSTYMWLTHSIFCYYYFQNWVTVIPVSTYMYISTFVLSLAAAWVLIKIEAVLVQAYNKVVCADCSKMRS